MQAPPPTGPKKPDIQPGPGRGQVAGAVANHDDDHVGSWIIFNHFLCFSMEVIDDFVI